MYMYMRRKIKINFNNERKKKGNSDSNVSNKLSDASKFVAFFTIEYNWIFYPFALGFQCASTLPRCGFLAQHRLFQNRKATKICGTIW